VNNRKSREANTEKAVLLTRIENRILIVRGHKVMLDRDLADLYGVTTANLNKAVSRNLDRFPSDFMLRLTKQEVTNLKFHFGTSSWGGTRKLPRVFTEHGVAMLSSVLRSKRAVQVNIAVMRTFAKLRQLLISHKDLARKLDDMEKKYDVKFRIVFDALRELMRVPDSQRRKIGFKTSGDHSQVDR
jgi:ORF6N domain-containing protein